MENMENIKKNDMDRKFELYRIFLIVIVIDIIYRIMYTNVTKYQLIGSIIFFIVPFLLWYIEKKSNLKQYNDLKREEIINKSAAAIIFPSYTYAGYMVKNNKLISLEVFIIGIILGLAGYLLFNKALALLVKKKL